MLEIQHLTAGYGEKTILHDISLSFPPGTVTAILGVNGCGKSTLFKAAAGLIPVQGGAVLADEPRARSVAYLPQTRRLPQSGQNFMPSSSSALQCLQFMLFPHFSGKPASYPLSVS